VNNVRVKPFYLTSQATNRFDQKKNGCARRKEEALGHNPGSLQTSDLSFSEDKLAPVGSARDYVQHAHSSRQLV
jgi:hypothetical protein